MSEIQSRDDAAPQDWEDEEYTGGGGSGRWLVAIGSILLVMGLFLTWYHVVRPNGYAEDTTGWQTFTNLRFLIALGALASLASVFVVQTRAVTIGRLVLGVVLTVLILRRMISPPDLGRSTLTVQLGVYVSLLGGLGIVFGSLLSGGAAEDEDEGIAGDAATPAGQLPPSTGEPVQDATVVTEPDRAPAREEERPV